MTFDRRGLEKRWERLGPVVMCLALFAIDFGVRASVVEPGAVAVGTAVESLD